MEPQSSTLPVSKRRHSFADVVALGDELHAELIDDELVIQVAPGMDHGGAAVQVAIELGNPFQRGRGGPGGWWFLAEVDVALGDDVVRPDLLGLRKDRVPELPRGRPLFERPDWICEIVSPSNAAHDRVTKLKLYHTAGVPHYWILDPEERTLTVLEWSERGYVVRHAAKDGAAGRFAPFDAIDLSVGDLMLPPASTPS